MSEKLKIVLLTIDRAGEILLNRLMGSISSDIEISLVVTRETRHYDFDGNPVVNACQRFGLNYIQPTFSDKSYLQRISYIGPDIIVISNFHKIIKKELIDIPTYGAYNLHSSLLPKMRGGTSIIWALKKGMNETGVTLHVVTEGVDDGDIISQKKVPISFWDSQGSLYEKITLAKFDLLLKFLNCIKKEGEIEQIPQDHTEATYLPKRKDDDGLLNVDKDLKTLYNHIRSFDPWTGAYFLIHNKKIRLRSVIPSNIYLKNRITDTELILGRQNDNKIKSLVISSVTDVIERPNIFDIELAKEVLNYWEKNA